MDNYLVQYKHSIVLMRKLLCKMIKFKCKIDSSLHYETATVSEKRKLVQKIVAHNCYQNVAVEL